MMYYGKTINLNTGEIISVQSSSLPLAYTEEFLEMTEAEYNDYTIAFNKQCDDYKAQCRAKMSERARQKVEEQKAVEKEQREQVRVNREPPDDYVEENQEILID